MYEYGSGSSDASKSSSSEYRYSGPFYQDHKGYGQQRAGEIPDRRKNSFPRLMVKVICVALVFGIVASAAFQAANYVGGRMRGEERRSLQPAGRFRYFRRLRRQRRRLRMEGRLPAGAM